MNAVEVAIGVAFHAHRDQTDKSGHPYILHPLRVMLAGETEDEQMVGVLHDVVEDTDVTHDDLRKLGFSVEVRAAVFVLSRREDQTYNEYIDEVLLSSKLARKVKLNDVRDNMRPGAPESMYAKYRKTIVKLEASL